MGEPRVHPVHVERTFDEAEVVRNGNDYAAYAKGLITSAAGIASNSKGVIQPTGRRQLLFYTSHPPQLARVPVREVARVQDDRAGRRTPASKLVAVLQPHRARPAHEIRLNELAVADVSHIASIGHVLSIELHHPSILGDSQ
jgi:hypothetical protein